MKKKYSVKYLKFARIYLLYPIFFYFFLDEPGLQEGELNGGILLGTIASIIITHIFFITWIKKRWIVTLWDNEFETFSMDGKKKKFKYEDLNPSTLHSIPLLVKFHLFTLRSDYKQSACITNWIENDKECFNIIEEKLEELEIKRQPSNDNKETTEFVTDGKLPKWQLALFIAIICLLIFLRMQMAG